MSAVWFFIAATVVVDGQRLYKWQDGPATLAYRNGGRLVITLTIDRSALTVPGLPLTITDSGTGKAVAGWGLYATSSPTYAAGHARRYENGEVYRLEIPEDDLVLLVGVSGASRPVLLPKRSHPIILSNNI